MPTPSLASLEPVLASQRGLITIGQLREHLVTDRRRRGLVERRVLRRVRPGVYALVGAPESWERGLLAAALAVEGSRASHSSAARLWQFVLRPEDRYELTVPHDRRPSLRGVVVHRSTTLHADDVVQCDATPTTSFERTLCDCTGLLTRSQLGRVLDDGLRRGVASLRRLASCAERMESAPGRHMNVVRSLLAERGVGFEPGGSRSELDLLEVFRAAGLPLPVQQYPIRAGGSTYRADFAWPDRRVFAEYYGIVWHSGPSAVVADSRRLTALSAAGWLPLVFTHESSDGEIVERTAAALRGRPVDDALGA